MTVNFLNNKKILLIGIGAGVFLSAVFLIKGLYLLLVTIFLTGGILIFYYGIKIYAKDSIDTLAILVCLIVSLSFIRGWPQNLITGIFFSIFLLLCIAKRHITRELFLKDYNKLSNLDARDIFCWVFLFLFVILFGLKTEIGFYAHDLKHVPYELSIGNSYDISIFNTPDLSYSGKILRNHFLSTRFPFFFSNLFRIDILDSAFFITTVFYMVIAFILINAFFGKYPFIRLPIFLLFFIPTYGPFLPKIQLQNLFTAAITPQGSFFLVFILMLMSIHYMHRRRHVGFNLMMAMMLLTKATFFITFLGGVFLYFVRNRNLKDLLKWFVPIIFIFLIIFRLFLSGTHPYNLWFIFPAIFYPHPLSLITWSSLLIAGVLFISVLSVYLKGEDDDLLLRFLSSVALSGLIAIFLLTEATEGSSRLFFTSSYFAVVLVFWYWLRKSLKNKRLRFKKGVYSLVLLISVVSFCSSHSLKAVLQNVTNWYRKNPTGYFSKDLIDAYSWVASNIPHKDIILFGKHYEQLDRERRDWWPDTHFMRSALGRRQMYCEDYKYKGVGSEEDFPLRFANSIYFYSNFVKGSQVSQKILDLFYDEDFGKEKGKPLSRYGRTRSGKLKAKILYFLSFGREWSWLNRPQQIKYEIRQYLEEWDRLDAADIQRWAMDFIKSSGIDCIILENRDRPLDFLDRISDTVYENNSVIVLRVKDEIYST